MAPPRHPPLRPHDRHNTQQKSRALARLFYFSAVPMGRSTNGWTSWTNDKGVTIDAIFRKGAEESA